MNDDKGCDIDDIMLSILHETINEYLQAAQNATNNEDRDKYLLQVKQAGIDLESYYHSGPWGVIGLTGETGFTGEAGAKHSAVPPVNHRREAILAQRARNK